MAGVPLLQRKFERAGFLQLRRMLKEDLITIFQYLKGDRDLFFTWCDSDRRKRSGLKLKQRSFRIE